MIPDLLRWPRAATLAALLVLSVSPIFGCGQEETQADSAPTCDERNCGRTCCEGLCVDLGSNPDHCGACGNACPSAVCREGVCQPECNPAMTACDGECVDLLRRDDHCGGCGVACGAREACEAGACRCAAGFYDCDADMSNSCESEIACVCEALTTSPCFTGPPAARGVGVCADGTWRCNEVGSGWGGCEDEILPTPEFCGDELDNDCDGLVDEDLDEDGDGFTTCQGDCCDSLGDGCGDDPAALNPGAFDVLGDGLDNDCNGLVDDDASTTCDPGETFTSVTPGILARSLDLCRFVADDGRGWGVLDAELLLANGTGQPAPTQTAAMKSLGAANDVLPTANSTMAALSSGQARGVGDRGYRDPHDSYSANTSVGAPAKFLAAYNGALQPLFACPAGDPIVYDSVMLRLRIRVPTNAAGFAFDHRFFSSEYPEWVCSEFNDYFLAMLDSQAADLPLDGNIAQDGNKQPVNVNAGFFTVCKPLVCRGLFTGQDLDGDGCPDAMSCSSGLCSYGGGAPCPDGTNDVASFADDVDDAGGTAWLTTEAPVVPGEVIVLDFIIWDTGDDELDSLVLLDNFRWLDQATLRTYRRQ